MPANIEHTQIVKHPLLSEKSTYAMNEHGRYSFVVDVRATKTEIKAAIESIYKVRVEKINTVIQKHRAKATKFGVTVPAPTKKAIIRLHAEDRIELF
jgi:large subunit ribosomal protein L23